MRTAKVSKVINGYRVDFYQDDQKTSNWFTSDMEAADAWADASNDRGQIPGNVSKAEGAE